MAKAASKATTKKADSSKIVGIRVEISDYDFVINRLASLSATTVNKEGKLGASNGEVLVDVLSNVPTNQELKSFIRGDFIAHTQALFHRIDEQTEAINRLSEESSLLRELLIMMVTHGDTSEASAALKVMVSGANVERFPANDGYDFRIENGANVEPNESDLISAFEQIKTSSSDDDEEQLGIKQKGVMTVNGTIRGTVNFHRQRNARKN